MAEQGQDQDRTEDATPFKLEEARKQGNVAKSLDVNSFAVLAGLIATFLAFGEWIQSLLVRTAKHLILHSGTLTLGTGLLPSWLADIATLGLLTLSPFLAVIIIFGVLGNILQSRPTFTFKPLTPDFNRINPASGLKRLLSGKTLFEAAKALLKLLVMGLCAYIVLIDLWNLSQHITPLTTAQLTEETKRSLLEVLVAMLLAFIIIAIVDIRYVKWDFSKKMRMSRRELKDEYKRREGDPLIKAKRKELQRTLAKKMGSVANVKNADVVVVNPQHLAVALKYDVDNMAAPKVISKGAGDVAARIRKEAQKHRIPIIRNVALTRLLFHKTMLDGYIPASSYKAVAAVLKIAYRQQRTTPN